MSSGDFDVILYLGDRALASVKGLHVWFALERRHPDGRRWLEVGRFASREDADAAVDRLVAHGQAGADEFRVRKVTRPPT